MFEPKICKQKQYGQGLVEYALILVLIAIVVIGILALLGGGSSGVEVTDSGDVERGERSYFPSIPFFSKRKPYPPRFFYGSVEDVVIQDIGISSVKIHEGPIFDQDARIAIYMFESPEETQGGVLVSDMFSSLLREKGYQVFERSQIERLLSEQELIEEGRVSATDLDVAERLGKLETVDYMIFGSVTLYNSEGQTIFLPVKILEEDRSIYAQEYEEYREWYVNGFRLSLDLLTKSPTERAGKLRAELNILSLEELEEILAKASKEEYRTIATLGISAKIVDVKTSEIVWMGQAETTDFTLVSAAKRIVDEFMVSILEKGTVTDG
jgi:pilus assembly protein Flp/PilA